MCVWSRVNCFAAKMAHLLAAFCQDVSSFRQGSSVCSVHLMHVGELAMI